MATVVCLRRNVITLGTDIYEQLDIVDGQQRLTTLVLLINAIKTELDLSDDQHARIFREVSELLVKPEGDNLLLLQTNHDTSHYFSDYLRDGRVVPESQATTLADRELLGAIADCRQFVSNWVDKDRDLLDIYASIKNRLSFILHEIASEKLVYTVFEVLNSRGIAVSWLDRLKSMLMGNAFELTNVDNDQLIADLHIIWRQIYAQIGLHQGLSTEALRFAATLYQSTASYRPLSERHSVDVFRSMAHDAQSIRNIARWLLKVTRACDEVISHRRQNAVTQISQARLLAVAIHLLDDISTCDRQDLLARWEKVSFRIYGMFRRDARTRVGDYVRLSWHIINSSWSIQNIRSAIERIGEDFPISEAVEELRGSNCYDSWQDELRYFMFRYEEHLAHEAGQRFKNEQWERIWEASASKSIEHIIPQRTADEDIKHLIGNLMMLPPGLNSKLRDKSTDQKLEAYSSTGLLSAIEVASIHRWSDQTVREREDALLEWAGKEWGD